MSKRRIEAYLYDILENANDIIEFTESLDYEKFVSDKKTKNAVIRSLEIIGEASRYIDDEFRENHPNVPWREMVGLRNILIHQYFNVDTILLWKIINNDVPHMKNEIEKVLRSIYKE